MIELKTNTNVLVLSGSGTNMQYELGICAEIQKLIKIEKVIGTSAGSIIGLAIAVGWDLDELINILIKKISGVKILTGNFFNFAYNLLFKGYVTSSDIRHVILDCILEDNQDLTFNDLDFDFTAVATDYTTGKYFVFNKKVSPNLKVRDAVLASSGIPILFKSIKIPGNLINEDKNKTYTFIDGFLQADYPYGIVPYDEIKQSFGVLVHENYISSGFFHILGLIETNIGLTMLPEYWSERTLNFLNKNSSVSFFSSYTTEELNDGISKGREYLRQNILLVE